ncbi:MAG: ATP-binding protein [Candidatus Obscuribacterales bacterium]|jgi:two-component system sensor histidine kinase KdpD
MRQLWKHGIGIASVIFVTGIIMVFHLDTVLANVSMLYLLVVFLLGLYVGRSASVVSALLSFAAFNWFFVEPKLTLSVHSASEWLALCMFLLISTITGQLTSRVQAAAAEAKQRQTETETLAKASWAVSSQLTTEEALTEVLEQLHRVADIETAAVISFDQDGKVLLRASISTSGDTDKKTLLAEIDKHIDLARGNNSNESLWTPVAHGGNQAGAVYVKLNEKMEESREQKRLIDALVNHAVVILQREELMKEQSRTQALKEADKLKTALLSMVSHDFRSPLTGIKAAVSALLQESPKELDSSEAKLLLQGIEQEADRINRMVGNILNLSRLEADAWKPDLESSSLAEIIGSALASFSADDNKRITVRLPRDLEEVTVDPVQIEQVIKNLIENALKYSDKETLVEILVSTLDQEVVLSVLDRGIGVAPEDANRIFDRFYRNPKLKETATPGVGIGLAICKALVEAHHGSLTMTTRVGGGSVFEVKLPIEKKS